jgi:hypothetical protein
MAFAGLKIGTFVTLTYKIKGMPFPRVGKITSNTGYGFYKVQWLDTGNVGPVPVNAVKRANIVEMIGHITDCEVDGKPVVRPSSE